MAERRRESEGEERTSGHYVALIFPCLRLARVYILLFHFYRPNYHLPSSSLTIAITTSLVIIIIIIIF